jgi:hypothetical protein
MGANRRLQTYLDALCDHWPEDYEYYRIGNEKSQLCVFCDDYHKEYPVHIRDLLSGDIQKGTGTFACLNCAQHIEALLAREWNIGSYAKDTSIDSSDETDRFDPSTERKNLLLMDLQFVAPVHRHYTFLSSKRDVYVANVEYNRCYICEDFNPGHPVTSEQNWLSIDHPVEYAPSLIGGPILICPDCEMYISDIHDLYTEKTLKQTLFQYSCPSCACSYYVRPEENQYREKLYKTQLLTPEWLCPTCTYDKINSMEEGIDVLLFEESNQFPRNKPMTRFISRMCYCCLKIRKFDLSLSHVSFSNRHIIRNAQSLLCTDCLESGIGTLFITENVIEYDSRTLIVLYGQGHYEVLQLKNESSYPNIILVGMRSESIVDAICEVFAAVDKFKASGD